MGKQLAMLVVWLFGWFLASQLLFLSPSGPQRWALCVLAVFCFVQWLLAFISIFWGGLFK